LSKSQINKKNTRQHFNTIFDTAHKQTIDGARYTKN